MNHPSGAGDGSAGGFSVESSETVYSGHLGTVRLDRVRMPDGALATREIASHLDAVAVVPLDGDGRVALVRQYRHAVRQALLEIPAGLLDVGSETPEHAAQRELAEEVGLAAERIVRLVRFHNSAGWSDEVTTVYLATGLREEEPPDGFVAEHEEAHMEVVRLPLHEAVAMVHRGEITDAKTIIGLLLASGREAR